MHPADPPPPRPARPARATTRRRPCPVDARPRPPCRLAGGYARGALPFGDPGEMPFEVFQVDSTPGLKFRLLPFVAAEIAICTTLPFAKLTTARSFFPRVPGPSQVHEAESQLVWPHFAN